MLQQNRIIQFLNAESLSHLSQIGVQMDLAQGDILYEAGEPIEYAHFLLSGLSSLMVVLSDGGSAEIGMVGHEGVAGAEALLGSVKPTARCLMQTGGSALRVPIAELRQMFANFEDLRTCILATIQSQAAMITQVAACNRLHPATERLARWLLMASDRAESEKVNLTQESLSAMLGTRRTTVALIAGSLQRSGMIRYSRGRVTILDREALTEAACECYGVLKRIVAGTNGNHQSHSGANG